MPSREELLQSIQPNMKLDRAFFLRVYGFEISFPGLCDIAIKALEDAGCSKARSYYEQIKTEYEKKKHEELREVAEWYQKKLDEKWERKVKEYERKEGKEQRRQEQKIRLSKEIVSKQILGW